MKNKFWGVEKPKFVILVVYSSKLYVFTYVEALSSDIASNFRLENGFSASLKVVLNPLFWIKPLFWKD